MNGIGGHGVDDVEPALFKLVQNQGQRERAAILNIRVDRAVASAIDADIARGIGRAHPGLDIDKPRCPKPLLRRKRAGNNGHIGNEARFELVTETTET
jgi:hypothetical protein